MAKDKYVISNTIDVVGTLDYNQNDELVICVERGKGDNIVIVEVNALDLLSKCAGRQIALKLTNEENGYDE